MFIENSQNRHDIQICRLRLRKRSVCQLQQGDLVTFINMFVLLHFLSEMMTPALNMMNAHKVIVSWQLILLDRKTHLSAKN